jgi:hypothetical protein
LVVALLFAVTGRYLLWRIFSSLDLSNPLNGIFSLGLLFTEIFALGSSLIQLYLMLHFKDRRQQARRYRQGLLSGDYNPTVDILIPTYNEPDFVLLRTIVGCQALEYPHKKIYVLDDTNRPQIKQLAQDLGCYYLARSEHHYAKAGNLNHALLLTSSELVAVFDAVFEAVGKPTAWEAATRLVRKGGRVNFFGGCPSGTSVTLETGLLHYSNLTLLASFHHTPRSIRTALDLIERGVIRVGDFVDGEASLDELPELFRSMAQGNRSVKTCIRMNG